MKSKINRRTALMFSLSATALVSTSTVAFAGPAHEIQNLLARTLIKTDYGTFAFYDRPGEKRPIVLVHGNSISSRIFEPLLFEPSLADHRLILIDLPGQGAAPDPLDPGHAYTMPSNTAGVVEVLNYLNVPPAILVGWSQGGQLVMEAAAKHRPNDYVVVLGASPIGSAPKEAGPPYIFPDYFFIDPWTEDIYFKFIKDVFAPTTNIPQWIYGDLRRSDPAQRTLMGASWGRGEIVDTVAFVASDPRPIAVIVGDDDVFVPQQYLNALSWKNIWRGSVQAVPGVGHGIAWDAPPALAQLISDFSSET